MILTVYSKTMCPYCVMTKNFLKNKNINFREINIEQDADASKFVQAQGHRTVPQIYMNGRLFVEGGWDGLSKMTLEDIISEIELRHCLTDHPL